MFYNSTANINIYDVFGQLATQMAKGRYLKVIADKQIQLWEDGYTGFVADFTNLEPCQAPAMLPSVSRSQIKERMGSAIAYIQASMQVENVYLWGGTVPPNYDCSGLIQAAFNSIGVWIPRDAYQQEEFAGIITAEELTSGDLIFFGSPEKASHVAMYLGAGKYIHSSGQEKGHNGIGINSLLGEDQISRTYAIEFRGFGRITRSLTGTEFSK